MKYAEAVERLGLTGVCLGGCGLTNSVHRRGTIFLDVVQWHDGAVNRRGLRRLLLLCAKRDRLASPHFLNDPGLYWAHMYLDERRANEWAAKLGYRFPASYSAPERRSVSLVPGLSRKHPAIYAWASRA